MSTTTRWIVAVVAGVAIICLLIWARGYIHHRGDEIGSLGINGTVASL